MSLTSCSRIWPGSGRAGAREPAGMARLHSPSAEKLYQTNGLGLLEPPDFLGTAHSPRNNWHSAG